MEPSECYKNNISTSENYSLFRSPVSEIVGLLGNAQYNLRCRDFEMNVLDCTDVYGHKGYLRQCLKEYEDLNECLHNAKQLKRFKAMEKERMRQYLKGERSKKDFYAEPPKKDSFDKTYVTTLE